MKSADHIHEIGLKKKFSHNKYSSFCSQEVVYFWFIVHFQFGLSIFFLLEHSHYLQYYKKTTNTKHYLLHTLRTN